MSSSRANPPQFVARRVAGGGRRPPQVLCRQLRVARVLHAFSAMRRAATYDAEKEALTAPPVALAPDRIAEDPRGAGTAPAADAAGIPPGYMARLTQAVGWRLVLVTWVMYGLDQGGIESLNDLGMIYFWKGRGLEPVRRRLT